MGVVILPAGSSAVAAEALKDATGTVDIAAAAAPATGQILTATDATHATWQDPAGGAPSGAAGGVLKGTYPNPGVDNRAASVGHVGSGVFTTLPWYQAVAGANWTSQDLLLMYFTAPYSTSVTNLGLYIINAGSGGAVSLAKLAIWAANNDGSTSAAALASTTSDTAIGGTANTLYTKAISSTALTVGQRYAIGALIVHTHSTLPKYLSTANAAQGPLLTGFAGKVSCKVTAQSDIPAGAIASGSLSNLTAPIFLFAS